MRGGCPRAPRAAACRRARAPSPRRPPAAGGYIPKGTTGPLLVGVYVAPDYRGDAIGVTRLLLEAVEDWAREHGDTLRLEVHEDNPRARRFYEKRGFTLTGRSREYELEPGGLELEMIKPLR